MNDIAAVRQAGKEMVANYDSSGRKWHIGILLINLIIYLAISIGSAEISYVFWHSLGTLGSYVMGLAEL